jgi:hypothetical protein
MPEISAVSIVWRRRRGVTHTHGLDRRRRCARRTGGFGRGLRHMRELPFVVIERPSATIIDV